MSEDLEKKVFWKIREFSRLLGDNHVTTINNYIKNLEDMGIHYVVRVNNQRVYDKLDFEVVNYILQKRKDGWSIDGINNSLRAEIPPVELRPFPDDFSGTNDLSLTTVNEIQTVFRREMNSIFNLQAEEMNVVITEHMQQLEERIQADRLKERQQKITDMITSNRIQIELEIEALKEWEKKPVSERYIKTGFFKKSEDTSKRDIFIKNYIKSHHEQRIYSSFGDNSKDLLE